MRTAEHTAPRYKPLPFCLTGLTALACLVAGACAPAHRPATGSWLVESPTTPGADAVIVDEHGATRWIYQTPGGAVIIDERGETEIIVPTQPPQPRG